MPRTLPWLTEPKAKTRDPLSTSSSGAPKRKRDATPPSDQDLVDPDLNPTGVSTPARRAKQRLLHLERSPSTSPPPAPPSVEFMREGYGADDAWMMVEDEFFATAQMFTQHLHHAAYAEQKRRAQARGEKVLRTLGRPTDGRTERNGMVVEREERDKSIKEALDWDKEDDDGDLTDPLLGALMNDPKRMGRALKGVGKVKSTSRAANGFGMSPEKKQKRTFPVELDGGGRDLDDELLSEAEADSDDLDGPASQNKQQSTSTYHSTTSKSRYSPSNPRRQTDVFKKFAAVANEETRRPTHKADRSAAERRPENGRHETSKARHPSAEQSNKPATTSIDDFEYSKPNAREETPNYLIKRRQRKEEEEKRKAKEKKAAIAVPTFML